MVLDVLVTLSCRDGDSDVVLMCCSLQSCIYILQSFASRYMFYTCLSQCGLWAGDCYYPRHVLLVMTK
jgi:hypothetical protein